MKVKREKFNWAPKVPFTTLFVGDVVSYNKSWIEYVCTPTLNEITKIGLVIFVKNDYLNVFDVCCIQNFKNKLLKENSDSSIVEKKVNKKTKLIKAGATTVLVFWDSGEVSEHYTKELSILNSFEKM